MNRVLIWKTCRVLANETRLRILKRLIEGATLCVTEISGLEGLSPVVASEHLRLLHESGFLEQEKEGKWTFYSAVSVPHLPVAQKIYRPLEKQLTSKKTQHSAVFKSVTAFTHPRRIEIVKQLHKASRTFDELIDVCGISFRAMSRHLEKLLSRGLIRLKDDKYELLPGRKELEKVLLEMCCQSKGRHTS